MPLLLLVWGEKQYHVVVQFYPFAVQQQKSIGPAEKEKLKKVSFECRVFSQYTANILPVAGIDIKIHTALCLAERYVDQFRRIDTLLLHNKQMSPAKIRNSFIKMAYLIHFKA